MAAMQLVLHMNRGEGETSYAKNSGLQRNIISLGNSMIKEAVVKLLCNNLLDSMGIADLGCSSGPNTLFVVSQIMDLVQATTLQMGRPLTEFRVFLNDLPGNDFNDIFLSLPAFYQKLDQEKGIRPDHCFLAGMPGSFYGRLFPNNSLHFIHSSSSLHWLSQVPPALDTKAKLPLNKGKIFISKTSPVSVLEAYLGQFQEDFSLFLKSRAKEIVPGGRMVLSFMGRRSSDPCGDGNWCQWELIANALMSMSFDGLVDEEKIDSFNAPYYSPCPDEVESEIAKEGSFIVDRLESFEIDWEGDAPSNLCSEDNDHNTLEILSSGQKVSKTVRAVVESMLESHFGREIMDDLFRRYSQLMDDYLAKTRGMSINLLISLVRKD